MKRTILMSLLVIGAVAAVIVGATTAYFSDPEQATGSLTAGTVDISVNGENPWTTTFDVSDLKPGLTRWLELTVTNTGANDVVIWKRLTITSQTGGAHPESEVAEDPGDTINNLAGWTFYDLLVDGTPVISDTQQVRVDDVNTVWIRLGPLAAGASMVVKQSYQLRPETTNWAQGDIMNATIELLATQPAAPSPNPASGTIGLVAKDQYWIPQPATGSGTVTYSYASGILTASFSGKVPLAGTEYSLLYYPDPYPGTGLCQFANATSDGSGNITIPSATCPVPAAGDQNMPAGIKLWMVPSADHNLTQMTAWNPSNYLFELNLVALP